MQIKLKTLFRQTTIFFLSFSLSFSGFVFTEQAQAAQTTQTAKPPSEAQLKIQFKEQKQKDIANLQKAFSHQSTSHLDQFQLTGQQVVDNRHKQTEAIIKDKQEQDYKDKLEYFIDEKKSLKNLLSQIKNKQKQSDTLSTAKQLNSTIAELNSRISLNQLELDDLKKFNPKDGNAAEIDWMVDQSLRTIHYWGKNMGLNIYQNSNLVKSIHQKQFTESLSPSFNHDNPLKHLNSVNKKITFSITDNKGNILHKFLRPISAIFFFGHYLVYVEKQTEKQTKTKNQLRFIDLNYFRASIGNAPLPVFSFPLKTKNNLTDISIKQGHLQIGQDKLNYQQFAFLSKLYQIIFNISVALVDGESYKNATALIKDIARFFNLSIAQQGKKFKHQLNKAIDSTALIKNLIKNTENNAKVNKVFIKAHSVTKKIELLQEILKNKQINNQQYNKLKTVLDIKKDLSQSNQALFMGRKLFTRINLLLRFLSNPKPLGSPKLFNSLVAIASRGVERKSEFWHSIKNNFYIKLAAYGLAAGGVALAANQLPEPYTLHLYKSLDLISATAEHFKGYMTHINYGFNYAELAKDAAVVSATGWTHFIETYLSNGVAAKFLYGLGQVLLIPIKLFAGVHFGVNSFKMFKESKKAYFNLDKLDRSFIKAFKIAAQTESKAYWLRLANSEKKISGSNLNDIGPKEEQLLKEHIARLNSKNDILKPKKDRFIKSYLNTLKDYTKKYNFSKKIKKIFKIKAKELGLKDTFSFRQALSHAFLSFSSLSQTFKFTASTWGRLFLARSFVFNPYKWAMALIYPNYFIISVHQNSQGFPSKFNSGLESWPKKLKRLFSKEPVGKQLKKIPFLKNILFSKESLKNLETLEAAVLPLEQLALEIAMRRSQLALVQYIKDPKRLLALFDSTQIDGKSSTGIGRLYDKKIKKLSNKEKTFFRAYFTRTFDLVMQDVLAQSGSLTSSNLKTSIISKKQLKTMGPNQFAKAFVKQIGSKNLKYIVSEKEIKAVSKNVENRVDFSEVKLWALDLTNKSNLFISRIKNNFRHRLLQSLHFNHPQINRFLIGKKKIQEPKAMERAVRQEVSSLVAALPIGIVSALALYAGVKTGLLVPFDPQGLDSETHRNYLSRYLFYAGFIPAIVTSLMASTWMKVQEDHRIDSFGGFNKMISYADGQKSFWRFYIKNLFKNPANKWRSNQIFMLKLITANLPAALVSISVANLYGLGRIDLGSIIAGYTIAYSTVLFGLNMKMTQAFELASSWVNSKIPRKLRAHPAAQKYINKNLQTRKITFGIVDTFWDVLVTENIFGSMLALKDHARYGTRSFLRLMFGGEVPTMLFANFIESLKTSMHSVWGADTILGSIKNLFTNNYEATVRYPEQLLKAGKNITRLYELEGLPTNKLAEFVGKTAAAVSSIGIFASIPYIGAAWLDKRKEKYLQKTGHALQAGGKCMVLFK